jgi:hypothetical protein
VALSHSKPDRIGSLDNYLLFVGNTNGCSLSGSHHLISTIIFFVVLEVNGNLLVLIVSKHSALTIVVLPYLKLCSNPKFLVVQCKNVACAVWVLRIV